MQGLDFGPRREIRDDVELAQQLADDLASIRSSTQLLDLRHHSRERFFGLHDRQLRVVLPLLFKTSRVFRELFPEELSEAFARGTDSWPGMTMNLDAG